MCCGRLSETDEDGITTTYAYDSARQLIETSRDAVYDGDVCVTPETITEYTRDAAGRTLCTIRRSGPLTSVHKQLISQLLPSIETKLVFISERGLTSTQWTEYSEHTKRVQYSTASTSSITVEAVMVDDFALSQKDTAGVRISRSVFQRMIDSAKLNYYKLDSIVNLLLQDLIEYYRE